MSVSILLVDDDPLLVQMMGAMLGDLGRVRFATSGEAALEQIAAEAPDLVLLDSEMPGMSGLDVCRTIRSNGEYGDIPVIFVTGHRDEEFEVRCLDAGAVDFIHKPVSGPILRARVRTHVRLKQALDTIRRMALTDPLTGLTNRRAFDSMLAREWKLAARERKPLGMLMIDIDNFKRYNDTYGHPAGDACLASVGHAMQTALMRPMDTVARYGGEEFAVLLPGINSAGIRIVAQRVLEAVLALRIPHRHGLDGVVSISVGGAIAEPAVAVSETPAGTVAGLASRADYALYRAKQQGRARTCIDEAAGLAPAASDEGDRKDPVPGGNRR